MPLRRRISASIPYRLEDSAMLQISLACCLRSSEDLLGFLFPLHVAKAAMARKSTIALTTEEWTELFGVDMMPLKDCGIGTITHSKEFEPYVSSMSAALRCTIAEKEQGGRWKKPWTQLLSYVSTHHEESTTAIESVLGAIVRSDHRRLEELQCCLDDDGVDVMMMAKALIAISDSII